ncbi:hypothetical protein [Pseudoalteromonas phage C7]|uniref:hypothetical protein n=1 Tax=Pseudoalteromonas phage C7 TaxID=2510494 RepID=UPI0010184F48|nr:hypothetical protein PP587_gp17 [Pseudoalteromonas phage C7]QAY17971.1 hypothetical protein [Pseudoalteromonas phage C7]
MLWDLMEWLQLVNRSALEVVVQNQSQSDIVLLMYLVSIKRSLHFAVAFLACESATYVNFFGVFDDLNIYHYEINFYLATCLVWCLFVGCKITPSMNRSLAFWCSIMVLLTIIMAIDGGFNADTETYLYDNYKVIVVCIHFCIILSFYRPSATIKLLVDNIRRGGNRLCGNYTVQFICYTVSNYTQIMAQRWLVRTRQL